MYNVSKIKAALESDIIARLKEDPSRVDWLAISGTDIVRMNITLCKKIWI